MRPLLLSLAAALTLGCSQATPATRAVHVAGPIAQNDTSWVSRAVLYEVFVRDFSPSGDFRGVIEGLDRIEAAGANVLWLMPIHPIGIANRKGTLGSPYAARDYDAVNPDFGTMADFKALLAAVHARKMKLILDWVPNHTAADSRWLREHPAFFVRDAQGAPITPRDGDGKPTDWTDVIQLDYGNPAMRREMVAAMQRWLIDVGIDGYRMDVAGFVPDNFWMEAVPALRGSVSRPILLLAEWGDRKMHRFGFDLSYSWDGYGKLKAVWRGDSAVTLVRAELADLAAMPTGGQRLRFNTNHDETAWDKPPVLLFGGSAGARAAFVAAALLPGRPLLYNGQEVESPAMLRLFERDTVAWDTPGAKAARTFYRRVLDLTRTQPALLGDELALVETTAPDDIIAYRRGNIVVLVNTRPRTRSFLVKGISFEGARDLLTGQRREAPSVLVGHGVTVMALPRSR